MRRKGEEACAKGSSVSNQSRPSLFECPSKLALQGTQLHASLDAAKAAGQASFHQPPRSTLTFKYRLPPPLEMLLNAFHTNQKAKKDVLEDKRSKMIVELGIEPRTFSESKDP